MSTLPAGWREATLGEVADWGSGGTPKAGAARYYAQGTIPWAVIGDLTDGPVTSTQTRITPVAVEESPAKVVSPETVLIAMYGSIGKLGLPVIPMATNQAIAFATPRLVDRKYLFYYLMSQRERLTSAGRGGTQQNISQTVLKAWPICYPPLDEQRRIVAILEDHLAHLDNASRALESARFHAVTLADQFAATQLLGRPFPGQVPPLLTSPLPILPADWTWSTLAEVADIAGGVTKDAKSQSDPTIPEVPYLRVANVQRGYLDLSQVSTIRVLPSRAARLVLRDGDVLLNEGGDRDKLARGWVWRDEIAACIHQNHVFRARPRRTVVSPYWIAWVANTLGAPWAQAHGKQTTNLASISLSMLRRMPMPLPPLPEQDRRLEAIQEVSGMMKRLEEQSQRMRDRATALRRSLLAAAFRGDLTRDFRTDD